MRNETTQQKTDNSDLNLSTPLTKELVKERIGQLYGLPIEDCMLDRGLWDLECTFGSLEAVAGKRILDLGCGCNGGTWEVDANNDLRTFEPWLCRCIEILGGQAVGVDIGRLRKEGFENHDLDLIEADALSCFEDNSFDSVNCNLLFSSPHLCRETTREERIEMRDRLRVEAERVLKTDGKFLTFDYDVERP